VAPCGADGDRSSHLVHAVREARILRPLHCIDWAVLGETENRSEVQAKAGASVWFCLPPGVQLTNPDDPLREANYCGGGSARWNAALARP
jgi:hypothetical protein